MPDSEIEAKRAQRARENEKLHIEKTDEKKQRERQNPVRDCVISVGAGTTVCTWIASCISFSKESSISCCMFDFFPLYPQAPLGDTLRGVRFDNFSHR